MYVGLLNMIWFVCGIIAIIGIDDGRGQKVHIDVMENNHDQGH